MSKRPWKSLGGEGRKRDAEVIIEGCFVLLFSFKRNSSSSDTFVVVPFVNDVSLPTFGEMTPGRSPVPGDHNQVITCKTSVGLKVMISCLTLNDRGLTLA